MRKNRLDNIKRIKHDSFSRFNFSRLDKNERVTNMPDEFFELIKKTLCHEHFTAYPEVSLLYNKISEYIGYDEDRIIVTAGVDGGIKNCFELFVEKGATVITLNPTFAMVDVYCQLYQARRISIGYNSKLELEEEKLGGSIVENISLIIIANPNSPTGNTISAVKLNRIIEKSAELSVPILIDEAYFGFCTETVIQKIDLYPNLIIARTFSKAMGLAGCRIGYLVTSKGIANLLHKFRPMYEVNSIGILAACLLLDNLEWFRKYCKQVEEAKKHITLIADQLKIQYTNTKTNFMHLNFDSYKETAIKNFKNNNILIGAGLNIPGYEQFLRVTIGPSSKMQMVIDEMYEIKA